MYFYSFLLFFFEGIIDEIQIKYGFYKYQVLTTNIVEKIYINKGLRLWWGVASSWSHFFLKILLYSGGLDTIWRLVSRPLAKHYRSFSFPRTWDAVGPKILSRQGGPGLVTRACTDPKKSYSNPLIFSILPFPICYIPPSKIRGKGYVEAEWLLWTVNFHRKVPRGQLWERTSRRTFHRFNRSDPAPPCPYPTDFTPVTMIMYRPPYLHSWQYLQQYWNP